MNTGWLNSSEYYFNKLIEQHVDMIRAEFLSVVEKKLLTAYAHKKYEDGVDTIVKEGWSGFLLRHKNSWIEDACVHAPETTKLLKSFPEINNQRKGTFGFSVVHKQSVIHTHTNQMGVGIRNRHQLCIDPKTHLSSEELHLCVSEVKQSWQYGKVISFDDGFPHSVVNNTDYDRAVLIYDSVP